MKNKATLILSGLGLNCEKETSHACTAAGAAKVEVVHMLRFIEGKVALKDYDFVVFIGGFLDGDYLGSARVGVNRFKFGAPEGRELKQRFAEFIAQGRLVLGICNGFQFLVKLGMLPFDEEAFTGQSASLTQNSNGLFEDRWVHLKVNPKNQNHFTQGLDRLYLPVRHGEGKIVVTDPKAQSRIQEQNLAALYYADEQGQPTSQYPLNPNGSWQAIAGLSNPQGNVFGLMPHPEAYNHYTNHPHWTRLQWQEEDGEGLKIFKNAYHYLNQQAF